MQQFWKSVKIWRSYREFKGGPFFETQCRYRRAARFSSFRSLSMYVDIPLNLYCMAKVTPDPAAEQAVSTALIGLWQNTQRTIYSNTYKNTGHCFSLTSTKLYWFASEARVCVNSLPKVVTWVECEAVSCLSKWIPEGVQYVGGKGTQRGPHPQFLAKMSHGYMTVC